MAVVDVDNLKEQGAGSRAASPPARRRSPVRGCRRRVFFAMFMFTKWENKTQYAPLLVAAALLAVVVALALWVPWSRLPAWPQAILPFSYFLIIALLRDASGDSPSVFGPLVILPVTWFALYGTGTRAGGLHPRHGDHAVPPDRRDRGIDTTTPTNSSAAWWRFVLACSLGSAVHLLVVALRRMTHDLGGAEERFRRAFDDSRVGMAVISTNGRFQRVNRALCELTGYPRDELVGKTFGEITHPDDVDANLDALRDLIEGERYGYRTEKRYIHADGHALWISLNLSPIYDGEDGAPSYLIAQIEDVSDRKESEERLTRQALHDSLTGLPEQDALLRPRADGLGQARDPRLRDHLPRPRRLQAGQRHARPRRRRPGPDRGRAPPRAAAESGRHPGPPGRRRVRVALRGSVRRGSAGDRGPGDRGDGRADRPPGTSHHAGGEHRGRPLPGRGHPDRARPDARRGRRRHVPGQGGRQVALRAVRELDARGRHRPHRARGRAPGGARAGRDHRPLPAGGRPAHRRDHRRRGAGPLAASGSRPARAGAVPLRRGGQRPDLGHRRPRHARGLPPGGQLARAAPGPGPVHRLGQRQRTAARGPRPERQDRPGDRGRAAARRPLSAWRSPSGP